MTKLVKMSMIKFAQKILDQEYFMAILKFNPKLAADNLPKFWPILSAINTSGCNTAKFLIPILEPLTHNKFNINDSFNFAKGITTYDSSLSFH